MRVCPPGKIFRCLQRAIGDWSPHNISVTCHILESYIHNLKTFFSFCFCSIFNFCGYCRCGRFLFQSPQTHQRMHDTLVMLMRKKSVKHVNSHTAAMIDNAFYTCSPPEAPPRRERARLLPWQVCDCCDCCGAAVVYAYYRFFLIIQTHTHIRTRHIYMIYCTVNCRRRPCRTFWVICDDCRWTMPTRTASSSNRCLPCTKRATRPCTCSLHSLRAWPGTAPRSSRTHSLDGLFRTPLTLVVS